MQFSCLEFQLGSLSRGWLYTGNNVSDSALTGSNWIALHGQVCIPLAAPAQLWGPKVWTLSALSSSMSLPFIPVAFLPPFWGSAVLPIPARCWAMLVSLACTHFLLSIHPTQPLLRTLDIGNVIFRYFYFLNHALLCNINLKITESTFKKDSNLPHELFCLFAPLMYCLHFVFCGKSNLCRSYSEAVTACCMVSCLS